MNQNGPQHTEADDSNPRDDAWTRYKHGLQIRQDRPLVGIPTGLPSVDAATRGLQGIVALGGAPQTGKSALACHLTGAAIAQHVCVLFYALRTPDYTIFDRLLCAAAGVDFGALLDRTAGRSAVDKAEAHLRQKVMPFLSVIDSRALAGQALSAETIRGHIDALKYKSGARQALVIFDDFAALDVAPDKSGVDADHHRLRLVSEVQNTLDSDDPSGDVALLICHLRKEARPENPRVNDLVGSVELAHAARCVMFLDAAGENDPTENPARRVLNVVKGQDGMSQTTILLRFDFRQYRFWSDDNAAARGAAASADRRDHSNARPGDARRGGGLR